MLKLLTQQNNSGGVNGAIQTAMTDEQNDFFKAPIPGGISGKLKGGIMLDILLCILAIALILFLAEFYNEIL